MTCQGAVLPTDMLIERTHATPNPERVSVGVRHTAADNACRCVELLAAGETLDSCCRVGILRTLDDNTSTPRQSGASAATQVFTTEAPTTRAAELDAAFSALADHLAERDHWQGPSRATNPARRAQAWYPAMPSTWRAEARVASPRAFTQHGVCITARSLSRA